MRDNVFITFSDKSSFTFLVSGNFSFKLSDLGQIVFSFLPEASHNNLSDFCLIPPDITGGTESVLLISFSSLRTNFLWDRDQGFMTATPNR